MDSAAQVKVEEKKEIADMSVSEMHGFIFSQFAEQYRSLSSLVARLPINNQMRSLAIQNFDTGMLWIKEAFFAIQHQPSFQAQNPEQLDSNVVDLVKEASDKPQVQ